MASRKVRVGGAWVTKPEYTRINGVWVLKGRYVRIGGAWASLDTLSASPNPCVGNTYNGTGQFGYVQSENCIVSGFSGAVSWTKISGDTMTISNASSTNVHWSDPNCLNGQTKTAVWRVSNNGNTFDVTVQLTFWSTV